jgi:hypothetical protein
MRLSQMTSLPCFGTDFFSMVSPFNWQYEDRYPGPIVIDSAGILSLFDLHKTFNKMITIEISGL